MDIHRKIALLILILPLLFGFAANPALAAACKSTDVIPIDMPGTTCISSAAPCPAEYTKTTSATCDPGFVCCWKLPTTPKSVSPLVPEPSSPSTPKTSTPKIGTKFLCEFNAGRCATGSGCDGSKYESAIGTCEGGVSCCKKDSLLEAAAKASAAKPATEGSPMTIQDPLGGADIPTLIGRVISAFLGMVGAIALLVFVYAGITYLTAAGREDAIKKARDAIKYAALGLALIVFAYVITSFYFQILVKGGS